MEENINYDSAPGTERKTMKLSEEDKFNLASSARWAKFQAIVGFVMLGLSAVTLLFLLLGLAVAGITLPGLTSPAAVTVIMVTVVISLAILLISFVPLFYLYRFAVRTLDAVRSNDEALMSEGFLNLRRQYKFIGILIIVVLSFYVISLIVALTTGFAGMFSAASQMMYY